MFIPIKLSDEQVAGIMEYLRDGEPEYPSIGDITRFIQNIVATTLDSEHEAVSDYIKKAKK